MSFSSEVKNTIKPFSLLNHPFYVSWSEGRIKKETLKEYAVQYYKHVEAFPRYISATHSKCLKFEDRKVLLENLNDEEGLNHSKPHPELWLQFAQAFHSSKAEIHNLPACESIRKVIYTFMKNAESSYEEGIASFYAYESQVPEIAETKIKGLIDHYNVSSKTALEFFEVHKQADVFHREECERLLDSISTKMQTKSLESAKESAQSLWNFLTEMQSFDQAS